MCQGVLCRAPRLHHAQRISLAIIKANGERHHQEAMRELVPVGKLSDAELPASHAWYKFMVVARVVSVTRSSRRAVAESAEVLACAFLSTFCRQIV